MKAYKKITAGLCAAMLCLGMAGCGSSSSDDKKSDTTSKANEITMKEEDKQQLEETSSKLEEKELENKTIKFFSHWDMNPGDGQVVPPGIQMFR
ncbi:MAG: carbohydrate ABC transporter substrate-binding protein, partial [Ruminococcus sp.]|nr:carbohydrate ABC transporter substrate-binding protein [Ruminococcus sp.]